MPSFFLSHTFCFTYSFTYRHALSLSFTYSHTRSFTHLTSYDLSTFSLTLQSPSWLHWAFRSHGSPAVCWLMSMALTWIWWHRVTTLQLYEGSEGEDRQAAAWICVCQRRRGRGDRHVGFNWFCPSCRSHTLNISACSTLNQSGRVLWPSVLRSLKTEKVITAA